MIATIISSILADQQDSESHQGCFGCTEGTDPQQGPQIQAAAVFAFKTHLESLEDGELGHHFLRVVRGQIHTRAGTGVRYNCTKGELTGDDDASSHCVLDPGRNTETFKCNFEVLEEPWTTHIELAHSKCQGDSDSGGLPSLTACEELLCSEEPDSKFANISECCKEAGYNKNGGGECGYMGPHGALQFVSVEAASSRAASSL